MTTEVPEAEEEEGEAPDEVTASPGLGKRRKNRKQRRRRIVLESKSEHKVGKTLDAVPDPQGDRRVPDFNFPELDKLCKAAIPQTTLLLPGEAVEEEEKEKRLPEASPPQSGPRPVNSKKAGSRRKRGGKRKKQRESPEPTKGAENKENKENSFKFEAAKSSDEDSADDSSSSPKFNWQNVTKNGMIKKCILVDGMSEGGRPRSGDTVLVKSQGKLREGNIVDDYPMLVFNVGEHEVIDGLDLAVQSMYKNELSIVSVKPEMAYGGLGRKGDIPANSRITYLFGLLHFEKQKEISQLTWAQRRKSGQQRMRLANWWYQRKEYSVAVKCYKRALEYYNNIPTNQECSTPEEYKELLQLMEERLRVMRQVANVFKRIANMIQSGQISS